MTQFTNDCVICNDAFDLILKCGHTYCTDCFQNWHLKDTKFTCCYCNTPFNILDYPEVKDMYIIKKIKLLEEQQTELLKSNSFLIKQVELLSTCVSQLSVIKYVTIKRRPETMSQLFFMDSISLLNYEGVEQHFTTAFAQGLSELDLNKSITLPRECKELTFELGVPICKNDIERVVIDFNSIFKLIGSVEVQEHVDVSLIDILGNVVYTYKVNELINGVSSQKI